MDVLRIDVLPFDRLFETRGRDPVILAAVYMITRKWTWSFYTGYIFLVLATTVLSRNASPDPHYELQPFWSYAYGDEMKWEIIANVIMFIPIGIALGKELGWKGIFPAAFSSLTIELLQLITRRGLFEFDDVIHNTLGAVIGTALVKLFEYGF